MLEALANDVRGHNQRLEDEVDGWKEEGEHLVRQLAKAKEEGHRNGEEARRAKLELKTAEASRDREARGHATTMAAVTER